MTNLEHVGSKTYPMTTKSTRALYLMHLIDTVECEIPGTRCDVTTQVEKPHAVFLRISSPKVITITEKGDVVSEVTYDAIELEVVVPMLYGDFYSASSATVDLIRYEFERKFDLCL